MTMWQCSFSGVHRVCSLCTGAPWGYWSNKQIKSQKHTYQEELSFLLHEILWNLEELTFSGRMNNLGYWMSSNKTLLISGFRDLESLTIKCLLDQGFREWKKKKIKNYAFMSRSLFKNSCSSESVTPKPEQIDNFLVK